MRPYETAFLITPKLEEVEAEKLIEKMADVVKKKKGKMVNIERWGKRRLAYPIDKLDEAVYVFFHYEGNPDIPNELQRRFRQTEAVIRYLTLRKEPQTHPRKKTAAVKKAKTKITKEEKEVAEEKKDEPLENLHDAPPEMKEPKTEELTEEK
jgi:small subunit ribosomal protein S6